MTFLRYFSTQRTKIIVSSIALLAILLVSGALPGVLTSYSSANNAAQTNSNTSSNTTKLASAPATFVGMANKFLSGPFFVKPDFDLAPGVSTSSSSNSALARPILSGRPLVASASRDPGVPPNVTCPSGWCSSIDNSAGGALTQGQGLNAFESTSSFSAIAGVSNYTIEPPDYTVCANSLYVMEILNIGELQIYSATTLQPVSNGYATLDNVMGLASHGHGGWSSGGDISCYFDYSNGGHWFITQFVSASPEQPVVPGGQPGPFQGCFVGVPNTCLEAIAVSATNNPFGSYNVYFLNPNKVNNDPGASSGLLLNDFAKIGATNDAFLIFYDEFNLGVSPATGFGSHGFNGAQEFAFNKNSLEQGWGASRVSVAYENMGTAPNLYPIPADGSFQPAAASCFSGLFAGLVCWYQVIPAQSPGSTQFDNSHGGTGFMVGSLDFLGAGDNRIAVFDWTDLSALNSASCHQCGNIRFGGQIVTSGVSYRDEGAACLVQFGGFCGLGAQKTGPIPLGDNCGTIVPTITVSCPESGIATNGDGTTQASFADGQLWAGVSTQVMQWFGTSSELHLGVGYWTIGTSSFDSKWSFTVSGEGYVSAAHEDLEYPAFAGENSGGAVIGMSLSGMDYFPSTAYATFATSTSGVSGPIHVADMGMAPADGFTEYQGFPGITRPRWGDYNQAIFVPSLGGVVFGSEYIAHPNCADSTFMSDSTCGGTRSLFANWGSSVNFIAT